MTHPPASHDDVLHRFLIDGANARGVLVRLRESWKAVRATGDYPAEVARVLAESLAATALFGGHLKLEGNLSLQLKGEAALRTVFAEYREPGVLRGLARWNSPVPSPLTPRQFGDGALLALTVETRVPGQHDPMRYQGLVGLDADSLASACERYFAQSEQLPTRLVLLQRGDQVAGLLLQLLPGHDEDEDAWPRLQALLDTVTADELLDLPAEALLYRLFHEDGVRLLAAQPLAFGCTCSRERVGGMLRGLGEAEAHAALQGDVATITCEFCGQRYTFDRIDIASLFGEPAAPGSTTPQ